MQRAGSDIFKVFRVLWFPLSPNAVLLGTAAVALFTLGSWLGSVAIGHGGMGTVAARSFVTATSDAVVGRNWPGASSKAEGAAALGELPAPVRAWLAREAGEIRADEELDAEARKARTERLSSVPSRYRWLYLWQVVLFFGLWSTFGVAICRILALRIARDEYCPLSRAFGFAWKVKVTGLLFPLAVGLPLAVLAGGIFVLGLVASVPWVGWVLGLLILPLVLFAAIIFTVVGITSLLSIGLVPAAIAIERKGTYDSLGKSINYTLARPIPLLFYAALVFAFLTFLHQILLEWDAPRALYESFFPGFAEQAESVALGQHERLGGFASFMARVHGFLWTIVELLFYGLLVSLFFGAFTSGFFIFREDVDGLAPEDVASEEFGPQVSEEAPTAPPTHPEEQAPEPASPTPRGAAAAPTAESPAPEPPPETEAMPTAEESDAAAEAAPKPPAVEEDAGPEVAGGKPEEGSDSGSTPAAGTTPDEEKGDDDTPPLPGSGPKKKDPPGGKPA